MAAPNHTIYINNLNEKIKKDGKNGRVKGHKMGTYSTGQKKRPNLLGYLVATNCMQCFLYGPIGCN